MKTILIDADSLIYYEAYKENLEEALGGIDSRVEKILQENNTTKYIMFLTEGKCFRYSKAITKDYKHNRKSDKPTWFRVIRSYLKDKYNAISIEGLEADDCVAYFSNKIKNSIIASPDKDVLLQCSGTHFNYQQVGVKDSEGKVIRGESKGLVTTSPEDALIFLYTQLLTGDSVDGVSGIEGVGVKTAEKMINSWINSEHFECGVISIEEKILASYIAKYGTVEGISRFSETFKLIYLLKTDGDMMREIKYIPEVPTINEYIVESNVDDAVDW